MKTNTTQTTTNRLDTMSQIFGRHPGLSAATRRLSLSASEIYDTFFRKHHPAAAAPDPSRGWHWVDYGDLAALDEAGQG